MSLQPITIFKVNYMADAFFAGKIKLHFGPTQLSHLLIV